MRKLRVPDLKHKTHHRAAFLGGLLIGISATVFTSALVEGFDSSEIVLVELMLGLPFLALMLFSVN